MIISDSEYIIKKPEQEEYETLVNEFWWDAYYVPKYLWREQLPFAKCRNLLEVDGIYISSELGSLGVNLFLALVTKISSGKKVIFPVPTDIKASINFIKTLIEENKFKAVIDREYPLDKISEAFTYTAGGQKTGNVILKVK